MRYMLGILVLSFGVFLGIRGFDYFWGNLNIKPSTTEISVLYDITDQHIGKPTSDEITGLFGFESSGNSNWNGAKLRVMPLSNVNFNQTQEVELPARNRWLSNELDRAKEIERFKAGIGELLKSEDITLGKPNSSIYWPLLAELKRLSGDPTKRRVLILQSDLMENSPDLSLYDPAQLREFTSNLDSVSFLKESVSRLPELLDIEVYLLYQPKDVWDSKRYTQISEALKNLLESKGAKVFRGVNL